MAVGASLLSKNSPLAILKAPNTREIAHYNARIGYDSKPLKDVIVSLVRALNAAFDMENMVQ